MDAHSILANETIWNTILPTKIKQILNNITNTEHYAHSTSTILNRAISETITRSQWSTNIYSGYKFLSKLLAQTIYPNTIRWYTRYLTISEGSIDTLEQITGMLPYLDSDKTGISIIYVQKGKTFLKNILDREAYLTRNIAVELQCIQNTTHFFKVYTNLCPNQTVIFTDQINQPLCTKIMLYAPILLNKFNKIENPTTPAEILQNQKTELAIRIFNVIYNLSECTDIASAKEYLEANLPELLNAFLELYDDSTNALNNFIDNLANQQNRTMKNNLKSALNDILRRIASYENTLANYYVDKHNLEVKIQQWHATQSPDLNDLKDFIKNSETIEIISAENEKLLLKITAPLQYFISSDFQAYINNSYSVYHEKYDALPIHQRILEKIFLTKEYTCMVQAYIKLNLTDSTDDTPMYYRTEQLTIDNYDTLPNPHLHYYNCWGDNRSAITKYINEQNYELALTQIIAAVQSINIAEYQSFGYRFLDDFKDPEKASLIKILDENKNGYTLKELLQIEKEKEQNNETN